ncbi:enoyl-CoA hydratase-related protein [Mycobacterium sp. 94-17]|uniref:enoyl-CoA hydratase-related protein n=1 Tax=Mycobacterium sp. 94-17 TaxID=2986147 RepID=UPI002D1F8996|nr:enoyl-CoA hydratase-related protein [Mycobacterium sp. 94-17]MEB4209738.1 enoyl-CoA hydratase-related protein [Mycobacterium sp. 94-17]
MTDPAGSTDGRRVSLAIADGVATLTLADPEHRNCVSAQMSGDVEEACQAIDDTRDVRVVVLQAHGPVFSAGGDIDSLERRDVPLEQLYRGFTALATLTVPTLAMVNGPVIGAGLNFALACDVIVAAESAYFESRFLDIGIHPGGGVLWALTQRGGRQMAAAMALFGERLASHDAHRLGLVWQVVPDGELNEVGEQMAATVARRPVDLLRRTKASLGASAPLTNRRDAVDLEAVAQGWSMQQPAFHAGVAALRARLQGQAED